jgi:hypothetical protein
MAFLVEFGLGGEYTLAQSHASASGASPKPSAATNKTAKEKYGLEAIAGKKVLLVQATSLGPVLAMKLGPFPAVQARISTIYPIL